MSLLKRIRELHKSPGWGFYRHLNYNETGVLGCLGLSKSSRYILFTFRIQLAVFRPGEVMFSGEINFWHLRVSLVFGYRGEKCFLKIWKLKQPQS